MEDLQQIQPRHGGRLRMKIQDGAAEQLLKLIVGETLGTEHWPVKSGAWGFFKKLKEQNDYFNHFKKRLIPRGCYDRKKSVDFNETFNMHLLPPHTSINGINGINKDSGVFVTLNPDQKTSPINKFSTKKYFTDL